MIVRINCMFAVLLALAPMPVRAQQPATASPPQLIEFDTFAKDFGHLKQALVDLQKRIDETTNLIVQNTDPIYPRQQADALKVTISRLLASVADNGPLANAGELALSHARERFAAAQRDTRFASAQRQRLTLAWHHVVRKTSAAVTELARARSEFLELLRVLQTNDDFLLAVEELRIADETVDAILRLSTELRDASIRLRDLSTRMQASGV